MIRIITYITCLLGITGVLKAQDFSELWIVGDPDNGNQTEFSQEGGADVEPGSAEEQDDDFYFAGTYDDPIGAVAQDEPFTNFDRALVPNDPTNRIHFPLDTVGADPGTQLRLSVQVCCFGAVDNGESAHDLSIRFNGTEVFQRDGVDADELIEETFSAGSVNAVNGANVIEIDRTDGSPGAWIQFDYIRLEAGAIDDDSDGMPNSYEDQFAFLSNDDASDAALDEDNDGLNNVGEFAAGSDPTLADTDGDTLSDGEEVNTTMTNPTAADSDLDGLTDAFEVNDSKSNPNLVDTDGDTLSDGEEVNTHNTSPLLADSDTDGVDDATEVALNTDPNDSGDIPVLFSDLWLLGDIDGDQDEFSQENSPNDPPGSAEEQDDDYYFAGTYDAPIGVVAADEPTANYDRALTEGDPVNRIHFNLDDISASEGSEYRIQVLFSDLGAPEGQESTHDVVMRLNDHEFFSQSAITGDLLVDELVSGADAATAVGENVLTIERTGGSGWIQFDYVEMDFRSADTDRDRMPNSYEAKFAFLDPNNPADAALDQDDDGLTNLEEFQNNTEPAVADTDSDGLNDGDEIAVGSKPRVPDTDGDGLLDGNEVNVRMTLVLDPDTDDDGLNDGDEIAAGTDPFVVDTDNDGESDNDEVLYGSNPTDPNSTPLPFETLWQLGEDDESQAEFSQEMGGIQAAPGSPTDLDDDYYFAGEYPDPIGIVATDEDTLGFERAITSGDPFNRIHFNLAEELVEDTTQMRLRLEFIQLGAVAGDSIHDVVVRVNGTDIFSQTDIAEDTVIQASFLPTMVGASTGENIIEIERTGQTDGSWIQFDLVRLEQRMILTDDPNLLVQTKNVFGELPNASRQTRTLEITNTGQENALNISNVAITGADRDHYTVSDIPASIGPREKASFTVTFDPKGEAGGFTAFLEYTSDDSGDTVVTTDLSALINNANGLVAHYTFDEEDGTSALDVSGRGRHAEYQTTGDGVFEVGQDPLAAGKSVSLSYNEGAAYGEVTDTFDPFVDTTFSLWFQANEESGVFTLLSKNLGGDSQGDPFALVYANGGITVFSAGNPIAAIGGVSVNEPHHLVVTFDNGSDVKALNIYLDGELAATEEDIDEFDDSPNSPLQIGALSGAFGFQGFIDDLQIYNKVLTAEEVTFLNTNPGEELEGEIVVDPNADDDGDGQSNTAEGIAGTDPNDPTSFFTLPTPTRSADGISFTWVTVNGTSYVLEYSTTLNGDWTEVTTVSATGATETFVDQDAGRTGDPVGYYRLRIP